MARPHIDRAAVIGVIELIDLLVAELVRDLNDTSDASRVERAEAALLRAVDVPLPNRMLYGFVAREGMRSSEALRMTWSDLDLERGVVRLDRNKTDDPRASSSPRSTTKGILRTGYGPTSRWRRSSARSSSSRTTLEGASASMTSERRS